MQEKFTQTLEWASPHVLIGSKLPSSQFILGYLSTSPITDKTLILYKAMCQANLSQIINEKHFLLNAPLEYSLIYSLMGCQIDDSISNRIGYAFQKLSMEPNLELKIKVICDRHEIFPLLNPSLMPLIFKAQSRSLYNYVNMSGQGLSLPKEIINSDWFEIIKNLVSVRKDLEVVNQLMDRIQNLFNKVPDYWLLVKKNYQELFEIIYREVGLNNLSIKELSTYFPNLFNFNNLSSLAIKIALLKWPLQAYLLGYPIHQNFPSYKSLQESLLLLSKLGKDAYVTQIKKYWKELLMQLNQGNNFANEENVYKENIYDFLPFDRLDICLEGHCYIFTREEFSEILKSKKNPYTNLLLPSWFLENFSCRVKMAENLGLPISRPILELYDELEKGTLFKKVNTQNNNNRISFLSYGMPETYMQQVMSMLQPFFGTI